MKRLVERLCSDACAGRAPGTEGGRLARRYVIEALHDEGLDPYEQAVPRCRGANVLAEIRGDIDRWVMGLLQAEVSARIMEGAFYELDAPVERVCTVEVPIPYAKHLEDAAVPQPATIAAAARRTLAREA